MGSNLAKGVGFLRMIKVHSMTFFRAEVKLSAPYRKIVWHVKDPCKI
jgi:hypothetical protein